MATHESAAVRREQILTAALQCFGSKGLNESKMDDIVEASGLSKGAIYFHFRSKDEIFLGVFEAFEEQLFAEWDDVDDADALVALERVGEISLTRILELRPLLDAWIEFIRQPTSRARMGNIYRHSRDRLAATVRTGIEQGTIRPADADAVAATLTALIEGLLLQAVVDPDFDPLPVWPTAWAITARGLAPE